MLVLILHARLRAHRAPRECELVFSSPSPRSYGERVGLRGSVHALCSRKVPLTRIASSSRSDLSPHPPSPEGGLRRTRAGRGDSKRCLKFESARWAKARLRRAQHVFRELKWWARLRL